MLSVFTGGNTPIERVRETNSISLIIVVGISLHFYNNKKVDEHTYYYVNNLVMVFCHHADLKMFDVYVVCFLFFQ